MIDWLTLRIPLDIVQAKFIELKMDRIEKFNHETGEIHYTITRTSLEGSFASQMQCIVRDRKMIYDFGMQKTIAVSCLPYLQVSCSPHKFLKGHNVYDGYYDIKKCAIEIKDYLEIAFDCVLVDIDKWLCDRIDIARNIKLDNEKDVEDFFRLIKYVQFPKRQQNKKLFDITGVYFSGTISTFKIYDKMCEYRKKTYRALSKIDEVLANRVLKASCGIIRLEVEIKKEFLRKHFKTNDVKLVSLDYNFCLDFLLNDMRKVFKVNNKIKLVVNTNVEVLHRLRDCGYTDRQVNLLHGFWLQMCAFDSEDVKQQMSKATYYRKIKQLEKAGISWFNSDVNIDENHVNKFGNFVNMLFDESRLVL